jgi:hypothetical protein
MSAWSLWTFDVTPTGPEKRSGAWGRKFAKRPNVARCKTAHGRAFRQMVLGLERRAYPASTLDTRFRNAGMTSRSNQGLRENQL